MLAIRTHRAKDARTDGRAGKGHRRRATLDDLRVVPEVEEDNPEGGRRTLGHAGVSPENLRITFENLLSSVSSVPGDGLDRGSVEAMVRSIYNWVAFDPGAQIDLPVERGKGGSPKMWPHGAVVDSRKKKPVVPDSDGPMKLRDLDEETASTVATSVVSSSAAADQGPAPKGSVVTEAFNPALHQPVVRYALPQPHYAAPATLTGWSSEHPSQGPAQEPYSSGYAPSWNDARYPPPLGPLSRERGSLASSAL